MSAIFVPVVDQEHTPLMPTTPSRARRWIRSGKATHFWKGGVFCVRLNVEPSAREQLGLKKTSKKLAEVWEAHCIDAWVLAYSAVGGQQKPDHTRLVCISPLRWHHRQLQRFEPEKGGKRKPYGGTLSLGIKRGTLVKHPKWGKAYVGGTMDGKLSLHDPETGKRLTQSANVADCRLIKLLRWKTRLAPLATARQGAPASSPPWKARSIRRRRVL